MRVLIAPDSYKGSLSAIEVARAMERGVYSVFSEATVQLLPVADGGEGTVQAMLAGAGGTLRVSRVSGPLGRQTDAAWGMLADGRTAVIEMAAASALPLLAPFERDPIRASTFGTGQLVKAALDSGAERILIGLGGSATNDAGSGLARALGVRFLDAEGHELPEGGGALARLHGIDLSGLDSRLQSVDIQAACDVDTVLYGPKGASCIFGPQKGATPDMVRQLDSALAHFAGIAEAACGKQVRDVPGSGAAGGLGAGLMLFAGARLSPGVNLVLDALNFEDWLAGADLVITGEGQTDAQTARGKAPAGVSRLASRHGVPVICVSGALGDGYTEIYAGGIEAALGCPPGPATLDECMANAAEWVEATVERACRLIRLGLNMGK